VNENKIDDNKSNENDTSNKETNENDDKINENKNSTILNPNQIIIPTYYLYIKISTARALAIIPSNLKKDINYSNSTSQFLSSTSTLLYLRLKLFSSTTLPIETPPILYESTNPSINATVENSTSLLSSRASNYDNEFNFNFNYSLPIAMTPQFIEKYKNTPIIVEVWKKVIHLGQEPPKNKSTKGTGNGNNNNDDDDDEKMSSNSLETKLMGLLRIPFQYIIASFIANKEILTSGNIDGIKMITPLILPEAEYPIMDPFTGISKGWVKSTLSLGPCWDQINKFNNNSKNLSDENLNQESNIKKDGSKETESTNNNDTSNETNSKLKKKEKEKEKEKENEVNNNKKNYPIINITIHRACGLKALVDAILAVLSDLKRNNDIESSETDQEDQTLANLNYSKKRGINPYVRLQIFPDMIINQSKSVIKRVVSKSSSKGNNNNKDNNEVNRSNDSNENDNIIITSICNETFTPIFEEKTSLEIQGDETEIIRWLSTDKKKGKAIGEIWHRFISINDSKKKSNHHYNDTHSEISYDEDEDEDEEDEDENEVYKDILIGTFEINLDFLVNRAGIINKFWVPIYLPKKIVEFFKEKDNYSSSSLKFLGASIQISINMAKGFDLGAISYSDSRTGATSDISNASTAKRQLAKFKINVNKVFLPINDDSEYINQQTVYLKWESPEYGSSNLNTNDTIKLQLLNSNKRHYYSEQKQIKSTYLEDEGIVVDVSDLSYEQEILIDYNTNVIEKLRDNQFEIEVWKIGLKHNEEKPFKVYIGSCFVDIYNLVINNRKTRQKGPLKKKLLPISGMYPLVNPDSKYMYGSKIELRIELIIKSRSRSNSYMSNSSFSSKWTTISNTINSNENYNPNMNHHHINSNSNSNSNNDNDNENDSILTTTESTTSTLRNNLLNKEEDSLEVINETISSIAPSVVSSSILEINEPKYKNQQYKYSLERNHHRHRHRQHRQQHQQLHPNYYRNENDDHSMESDYNFNNSFEIRSSKPSTGDGNTSQEFIQINNRDTRDIYENLLKIKDNTNLNINNINSNPTTFSSSPPSSIKIIIERAFHISIPKTYNSQWQEDNDEDSIPYVFVTLEWKYGGNEHKIYKTEICHDSSPLWNYEFNIPQEVNEEFFRIMQDNPLQFKVWHVRNNNDDNNSNNKLLYTNKQVHKKKNSSTSDFNFNSYQHYLIGCANISIKPLLSCVLREMRGWYNITNDDSDTNNGTLGIFIRPSDYFFKKCKEISHKTNLLFEGNLSSSISNHSKNRLLLLDQGQVQGQAQAQAQAQISIRTSNSNLNSNFMMNKKEEEKVNPYNMMMMMNSNFMQKLKNKNDDNEDDENLFKPNNFLSKSEVGPNLSTNIKQNKTYSSINYDVITPTSPSNSSFLNLKAQLTEKLTELDVIQKDMLSKFQPKANVETTNKNDINYNYNNNNNNNNNNDNNNDFINKDNKETFPSFQLKTDFNMLNLNNNQLFSSFNSNNNNNNNNNNNINSYGNNMTLNNNNDNSNNNNEIINDYLNDKDNDIFASSPYESKNINNGNSINNTNDRMTNYNTKKDIYASLSYNQDKNKSNIFYSTSFDNKNDDTKDREADNHHINENPYTSPTSIKPLIQIDNNYNYNNNNNNNNNNIMDKDVLPAFQQNKSYNNLANDINNNRITSPSFNSIQLNNYDKIQPISSSSNNNEIKIQTLSVEEAHNLINVSHFFNFYFYIDN